MGVHRAMWVGPLIVSIAVTATVGIAAIHRGTHAGATAPTPVHSLQSARTSAPPVPATFPLTAAQRREALLVAHDSSYGAVPSSGGAPEDAKAVQARVLAACKAAHVSPMSTAAATWPADVTAVQYLGMYRQSALAYLDGSTGDDSKVILVRLVGRFAIEHSSPPGGSGLSTARALTMLANPRTGEVSDYTIGDQLPKIPGVVVAFARP